MDYKIHYTGSKGNSNIVEINGYRFLIDCGVPFSWLESENMISKPIDFLLITHKHSDHIKLSTYNRLRKMYPKMLVITNYEVAQFIKDKGSHYQPHYIIDSGLSMNMGDLEVNFIENVHGVETQGYIFNLQGEILLYATDLSTTAYYEQYLDSRDLKVDICLLENNYDIEKLMESLENHTGYNKAEAQSRHLEHEAFWDFVYNYCKEPDKVVELHQSSSLY